MSDSYKYVIRGEPIPFSHHFVEKGTWNHYRSLKLNYILQLENQHGDKPKLNGPIALTAKFYFSIPQRLLRRTYLKPGLHHIDNPPLFSLAEFIAAIAQECLLSHAGAIATLSAEKYYDHEPRVELEIEEIR